MKKLLAFALVLVMGLTVLVGCTGNNQQPTEPEVAGPATALEVLENVWNLYGEDDKFAVIGGNMENPVDGAPGAYDMAYAENLTFNLVIPAEELGNVTEAATMIHMMNANTFTAGVVKLADGVDVAAFAATMNAWNGYVAEKNDPDFGRVSFTNPLNVAPFYAIKVTAGIHHTMGGVKINTETQVLTAEGTAIPGLFAAGEVTGGVHGANRLGGNAVSDFVVFGRIAGAEAAELALAE